MFMSVKLILQVEMLINFFIILLAIIICYTVRESHYLRILHACIVLYVFQ